MVPMGSLYTVTEIMQDNYWIKDRWCVYSDDGQEWINTDGDMNSIVDIQVGYGYAACEFVNSKLATLTVVKDAIPDSTQPFTFSVSMYPTDNTDSTAQIEVNQLDVQGSVNGYGSLFQLIDDGTGVSNTKTLTDGMAGYAYFVSEPFEFYPLDEWMPIGAECATRAEPWCRPSVP